MFTQKLKCGNGACWNNVQCTVAEFLQVVGERLPPKDRHILYAILAFLNEDE
jgi:hypothetical protein